MMSLGINGVDTGLGEAGVGFLVVPRGIDRDDYMEHCYRTHTVTMHIGYGSSMLNNVPVDMSVMQTLDFPEEEEVSGTPLIWIKDTTTGLPIIVASIKREDEYHALKMGQYSIHRMDGDKAVELVLDATNSSATIYVNGNTEDPADFTINLSSSGGKSKFIVESDGDVEIQSTYKTVLSSDTEVRLEVYSEEKVDGALAYKVGEGLVYRGKKLISISVEDDEEKEKFSLRYENGSGLKIKDEFGNEITAKDGEVSVKSEKIKHNDGSQSSVRGDDLKSILEELISAITTLTVPTAFGPSGVPINASQFQSIKGKLNKILSKKSYVE